MTDEYNWDAIDTIGTWTALMGSLLIGIATWLKRQRHSILEEVSDLRASLEKHVTAMRQAHGHNEERLIKLETHEQNTEARLLELNGLLREMNHKTDRIMEFLMNSLKPGRK